MYHQEFEPNEALQDTIKCFWYNKMDYGELQSGYEVLPDGYAEIIFHFGSSCNISVDGIFQALPSPFLVGLLNQPVNFYAEGHFEIIAVRCFPWTVFDLLGLPSGKDGLRTLEHPVAELQSNLSKYIHAGEIDEAVNQVEQYFMNARSHVAASSMLSKAGIAMRKAKGIMPVSDIAAAAHTTVRTLERNFKHSSGYTVKDVSGLMRFEQVRNQLWHYPNTSISSLSCELGYTDQSHLSREFKRYSGTTPATFARKAKQRQQAVSGNFVAFIQV